MNNGPPWCRGERHDLSTSTMASGPTLDGASRYRWNYVNEMRLRR